jgi:hypothetical protein
MAAITDGLSAGKMNPASIPRKEPIKSLTQTFIVPAYLIHPLDAIVEKARKTRATSFAFRNGGEGAEGRQEVPLHISLPAMYRPCAPLAFFASGG